MVLSRAKPFHSRRGFIVFSRLQEAVFTHGIQNMKSPTYHIIDPPALNTLLDLLHQQQYTVIGPTVRDNTIVYDELAKADDLPVGVGDEQEAGTYRLKPRADKAYFGYNMGPHAWKKFLFPSALKLFSSTRTKDGVVFAEAEGQGTNGEAKRFAFIGVRSCELHAILIQDKVFTGSMYTDPHYVALREKTFIVAVDCTQAAPTCFCASMNTGPRVDAGYDLCLTEVIGENTHYFVVRAGSKKGGDVMAGLPHREPTKVQVTEAAAQVERTATSMKRTVPLGEVKGVLQQNPDHPQWDVVGDRCLSCANCSMVCPTCFCHTVEDTTDLTGARAERWRRWDSCFTIEFSYIHGGSIRTSPRSRYRQWLSHKFAHWFDQFGTAGCVGCGRCITWCPVGIDVTEEIRAIKESAPARQAGRPSTSYIPELEEN
jgi:sulfhydrogenase subunit beta (sulfur reductase)